jgi:phosphonate ABC transporter permease subunit PhnE
MAASATTERPRLEQLMAEAGRHARIERSRNLAIAAVFVAVVYISSLRTEFRPQLLVQKSAQMGRVLDGFLHPDFAIVKLGSGGFPEGLVEHFVIETLGIAVVGTVIGTVIAIPVSFLAARNLARRNPVGTAVYYLLRTVMSVTRSVPTLFWGILFVTVVSLGPFPGVLAVSIFSFGLMSKLFSEAIEAIDVGQVEALTATGASFPQVVVHGVVPQVTPYLVAHLLYTFEVNVHSATILGTVGAGGVGFLLIQYIDQFLYPDTAMLLIVVILMTVAIDNASAALRRLII